MILTHRARALRAHSGEIAFPGGRIDPTDPTPEAGEVLVKTLACGICGSDLHMADHCHDALAGLRKGRVPVAFEPEQGVVFGHEFCAEILDHGPGCDKRYKA